MNTVKFLAAYWWVWCIVTICLLGLVYTDPALNNAYAKARKEADNLRLTTEQRQDYMLAAMRRFGDSAGTYLRLIKVLLIVFGALLFLSLALKLFGY